MICSAGIRTVRTRAAVNRLARLETALSDRTIRSVHFAVPGDVRWVDQAGREVRDAPGPDRYVVLSDESGPMLRLLLARRADQEQALAGLNPAAWLALRNAQSWRRWSKRGSPTSGPPSDVWSPCQTPNAGVSNEICTTAPSSAWSAWRSTWRVALRDVSPATAAQLTGTEARIDDALAHLRQLAHGMFPSVLADEGLEAALEELLVASDIPATLDIQVGDVGAGGARHGLVRRHRRHGVGKRRTPARGRTESGSPRSRTVRR